MRPLFGGSGNVGANLCRTLLLPAALDGSWCAVAERLNAGRNLGVKLKCVKFHKILLSLFGGKNVMQCGGYKDAVFVRVQLLLMCLTVTALGKACQGN
ncbi:MAG: hypothetical protein COV68_03630 [Nitrospirae bacterium CG11_big_fil_rev_8_21_14_0_20_41_14]|nr:MAG: hypothetical protein AUK38_03975 [Nitrospirae bacterium CG2_30_41_42]PIQ94636.1 MAG: hypothetical protein COV68_03630 [Nitrospirae bacterium CG11_big_fil_rev_8_21_14_0_20_41_14]